MKDENLKLVIVGHVDHGKSTLIGRLFFDTGSLPEEKIEEVKKTCEALGREMEFAYVMDHLEEERSQGITIDTSQTFFSTGKRAYTIIDAPGHVEFTKNMITGASQAEAAILIVDVKEGVKEQTRRHAYILSLLGLRQVIVAINKMDLAAYSERRFGEVKKEILSFLKTIGIEPSYIIPISAKKGDNIAGKSNYMEWYGGPTILKALDTFESRGGLESLPLRLPVQDVYKIGDKRVIVGRVEAGTLESGQEIILLPCNYRTKISGIEEFLNPEKRRAGAGESIGITISEPLFVDRGQVVCAPGKEAEVVRKIKGNLFWMSETPLKKGEVVRLKCATQEVSCVVRAIQAKIDSSTLELLEKNAEELKNREVGEVLFEAERELVVDNFNRTPALGRFVIEKNLDTAGGGILTEV